MKIRHDWDWPQFFDAALTIYIPYFAFAVFILFLSCCERGCR